jgi:methionyl-tRNA synthetase
MTDMESPTTPEPTPTESVKSVVSPSHAPTADAPTAATDNLQPATGNSPQISIDDFAKVDLRVAQIVVAERIPKADKLLRLEVDLGPLGQRQILSGIAEWYTPEEMVGRRIIVIANLAPRKMRGLESHGMLLAASEEAGKPYLATVPEGVPTGTRLK